MANAGISGVYAPARIIITLWFSSCQCTVQTPLNIFPHCHTAEGFLLSVPFSVPSFDFVLFFSPILSFKCVDVMCVGGSVKLAAQTGSAQLFRP